MLRENRARPAGQNILVALKIPLQLKNLAAPNNPVDLKIRGVKRWSYATRREARIR
jgi:hypothetical protein